MILLCLASTRASVTHVRRVVSYHDGLTASAAGVKHGVMVRVPVSLMVTPGEYLFVVHAVDDHPDEEKYHRRKPALPLNAQVRMPSVDIYAPDDALEFRRGCQIDVRIMVKYYRSGDTIQLWVDDSLKANLTMPFYLSGNIAKFSYVWDTSQTQCGAHVIRAQLLRDGREIGFADTQRVRIFAMRWPEPGIIWGGFNPTSHRGVDIWFSDPYSNVAGFSTCQSIQNAHEGIEEQPTGQSRDGVYRYWVRTADKNRVDFIGEKDGIPIYKERYVWTYYAHLKEHSSEKKREDNSGNAATTGSHLHFSVFLSTTEERPNYSTGESEDPLRWLQPETFYTLTGTITDQDGNPMANTWCTTTSLWKPPKSGLHLMKGCPIEEGSGACVGTAQWHGMLNHAVFPKGDRSARQKVS